MKKSIVVKTAWALALAATTTSLQSETIRGVTLEFADVGNPQNAADTTTVKTAGAGDVAYPYSIGKYEVTARQWADFLNQVDAAGTNPLGLWSLNMENNTTGMQINNNGTVNGQRYAAAVRPDDPVVHVKWHMAARFCNYLTSGNTEQGPYIIGSGTTVWAVDRAAAQSANPTIYVLPTLDEWYKAAYHKGAGLAGTDYWDFPNQADVISTSMANYGNLFGRTTEFGHYASYPGAYGTFDQGGNVREWLETQYDATRYMYRGGSWDRTVDTELKCSSVGFQVPHGTGSNLGFRIVKLAPSGGFTLPAPVHQSAFVGSSVSPFGALPAFCTPFADTPTGYTLARLGGTSSEMTSVFPMPAGTNWSSDHAKHWYNMMPAINCNDTMAVSNARSGAAAVWDTQTLKHLGWIPAVGSALYPESSGSQREVLWDKLNPNKYYFCSQNRIMTGTITRLAGPPATVSASVQQVYSFTGFDFITFGDTKGDFSRDNKRVALVAKRTGVTNALTMIAFQMDTLTISGTRDIADNYNTPGKTGRWEDFDGGMVDPTGQYMCYDSGANGLYSLAWNDVANPSKPWIHVTTAHRHGELVVGPDNVTPYWVRNSNMNGVLKHDISKVDESGTQLWSVAGSDGHMSGIDNWPGKFIFSRYKDGGIYLLDLANPGYSYYLGNSRHFKADAQGTPNSYGQQPKGSISATGRTILFISDNNNTNASAAYVYGLKMPQ